MFQLYGLSTTLDEALSKRVWLKSGGYLVIEPTEALTVIDVNTGKFDGKKKTEETFALINREAAQETARQMRLRNLSGIIIVDFINQEKAEAGRLLEFFRECCKKDTVPVRVVDMTPLGLVEITRKKVRRPLAELIREVATERK
ncbi:MAG: ribonuclease E/G [Eisenbergiella sp.]